MRWWFYVLAAVLLVWPAILVHAEPGDVTAVDWRSLPLLVAMPLAALYWMDRDRRRILEQAQMQASAHTATLERFAELAAESAALHEKTVTALHTLTTEVRDARLGAARRG